MGGNREAVRTGTTAATAVTAQAVPHRTRWTARLPRILHVLLLVSWTAVLLLLPVVGHRASSEAELLAAVEAGRVDTVEVVGGLSPADEGEAWQQARWHDGLGVHVAEQVLVRGGSVDDVDDVGTDGEVSAVDLADRVRAVGPDVEVRTGWWGLLVLVLVAGLAQGPG